MTTLLEPLMTIGSLLAAGVGAWVFSRQMRALQAAAKVRDAQLKEVASLLRGHFFEPERSANIHVVSEATTVAHIGDLPVVVRLGKSGGATLKWTVDVQGRTPGPDITWDFPTANLTARPRLLTGDEAFDAEVVLRGPAWATLACLDAARRDAIRAVVKRGATNDGARWTMVFAHEDATPAVVAEMARLLVAASPDWEAPEPGARLAELVRTDPCEGVRVSVLQRFLAADGPGLAWGERLARELALRGGRTPVEALRAAHTDEVVAGAFVLQQEGTVADLPALREVAGQGAVATAVQAAITAIVARSASSVAGQLSVSVDLDEGALSRPVDGGDLSRVGLAPRASER